MNKFFRPVMLGLMAALALVSAAAQAQTVDISSLPEDQRKSIQTQVEQSKPSEAVKASKEIIDHAREWAGLGQAIASGVVGGAKELGIAANDFAKTDLGKITVAVLLWKYLGSQVVGILFGTMLLVLGPSFGWFLVRRSKVERTSVEYVHVPWLFGAFTVKRVAKRELKVTEGSLEDHQAWQQFIGYALMVVGVLAGLIAIF